MASNTHFRTKTDKKYKRYEDANQVHDATNDSAILFPEIMAPEELLRILQEHGVELNQEDISDKSKLVELYYKTVIPLPQRKYRMNRRGREATKNQIIQNKKRKSSSDSSPFATFTKSEKSVGGESSSRFMCSYNIPSASGDRLKPPPVKAERKIISLKSSSSSGSKAGVDHLKINTISTNSSKDTTTAKTVSKSPSSEPIKIKSGNSEVHSKTLTKITHGSQETNSKQKIIRLNRSSLGLESNKQDLPSPEADKEIHESKGKKSTVKETEILSDGTMKVSTTNTESDADEVVSKKFKKVSITWP